MNAKRIVMSLGTLVFVAAVVAGGTGAFFSDTETSEGNVFAAGAIDLRVSNESYYNGEPRDDLSWESSDLTDQLFFNYADLKPGDWGEDTIDLIVENNPAYACMDITLEGNDDNGLTEPEEEDGDTTGGEGEGELQNEINFVWWIDDGDNVLEDDEQQTFGQTTLAGLDGTSVAISDSSNDSLLDGPLNSGLDFPETGTYYIGKAWCYGELTEVPVDQDGSNDLIDPTGPQGPGIECNGSLVTNVSQSDSATVGLSFFAVQSRNNEDFTCSDREDDAPEPDVTEGNNFPEYLDGYERILQVEARSGDNIGNAGDWELGIGQSTQPPVDQDNFTWGSDPYGGSFTVSYDGTTATADLSGNSDTASVSYAVSIDNDDFLVVVVRSGSSVGDETTVDNLVLNGNPLSDDDVTVLESDSAQVKHLIISGIDLSSSFTLTGDVEYVGSIGSGSAPEIQVQVGSF